MSNDNTYPDVGTGDIRRFCQLGPLTRRSEDLWPLLTAMKASSDILEDISSKSSVTERTTEEDDDELTAGTQVEKELTDAQRKYSVESMESSVSEDGTYFLFEEEQQLISSSQDLLNVSQNLGNLQDKLLINLCF